jgi:hypothetical protein
MAHKLFSTLEYLLSASAGVVARVESLPLAAERLGDFVRGRMGESTRQASGRACRDLEGLFESLLAQSFDA